MTEEAWEKEARKFTNLKSSPLHGVIGAINIIVIAIHQPRTDDVPDPQKYFNRKGFFAVVV